MACNILSAFICPSKWMLVLVCASMSVSMACVEAMPGYLGPNINDTDDGLIPDFSTGSGTRGNDTMSTLDGESSHSTGGSTASSDGSSGLTETGTETKGDTSSGTKTTHSDDAGDWETTESTGTSTEETADSGTSSGTSTNTGDSTSTTGDDTTTISGTTGDTSTEESSEETSDAEVLCIQMNKVLCGEACVDIENDRNHCGQCGHACGENKICYDGICKACEGGKSECDNQCVDPDKNNDHCGKCYNACAFPDFACGSGFCQEVD